MVSNTCANLCNVIPYGKAVTRLLVILQVMGKVFSVYMKNIL